MRGTVVSVDDLYRRHSEAAWRVAYSITRNRDDASDAVAEAFAGVLKAMAGDRRDAVDDVRPYLMAATRNAAVDLMRRSQRVVPTGQPGLDDVAREAGPSERLVAGEDRDLLAEALGGLPPRWRAVLWLTEVEGMPPRDVAVLLDLSPNNVAQLATRARARLRRHYVQSHVRNHASGDCAWTAEHLGGLATGGLTEHQANRVRGHLAECGDCRARMAELDDLGMSLRRAAVPAALVLRRSRVPRWLEHVVGRSGRGQRLLTAAPDPSAVSALAGLVESPVVQGAVAAVTAAVLALGVGTAAVRHDPAPADPSGPGPVLAAAPPAPALAEPPSATTVPAVAEQPTTTLPAPTTTAPATAASAAAAAAAAPTARAPFTPGGPLAAARTSTVATAAVTAVAVADAPGGEPFRTLPSRTALGSPVVLLVTGQEGDWLEVSLPVRPNGSTGWVRRDQVGLATHSYSITVELGAHRITVYDGAAVLLSEPIGVGTADAPTPGGRFYTTELVRPTNAAGGYDPGGPYGPYAYPLSGFSDVLFDFAGGDGQFGIHGTNDPSGLGRDVSHGCIRMSNAGITRMAGILPLGVPVEILT